jgi:hypothetical protein
MLLSILMIVEPGTSNMIIILVITRAHVGVCMYNIRNYIQISNLHTCACVNKKNKLHSSDIFFVELTTAYGEDTVMFF